MIDQLKVNADPKLKTFARRRPFGVNLESRSIDGQKIRSFLRSSPIGTVPLEECLETGGDRENQEDHTPRDPREGLQERSE